MPVEFEDLRSWVDGVDAFGELKTLRGADWNLEIGAISTLYQRHLGGNALMFDDVVGYPTGHRVLTNTLMSVRRIAYTLGADLDTTAIGLIHHWRGLMKGVESRKVTIVDDGPVNENVENGSEVNLLQFPTPLWNELDGGRYIGTGCVVIMKDYSTDWINLGTYRVMIHDENHVGLHISPGKHGRLIRDMYWDKGEPVPVAVSLGQDPLLTALGGLEVPYGSSEYDVAGWIRGKSTPVIVSDLTGLPIPSTGEIVIEGFMHPNDDRDEGPFGEWTGYYAGGRKPAPQITIERIRYRTNPILLGVLTGRPPTDDTYYRGVLRSAMIWEQLEASGIPGITGVWVHEASGGRLWVTVSVKQMYAGHSTQVAHVASQCHAGAYANRFVVVVDDDIDVTDTSDVIWAMCTRMDASEDVSTIVNAWSTGLDPMAYQRGDAWFNSRLIIDASRPWNRRETFPTVVAPSRDYRAMIVDKWASELPELRR